MVPGSEKSCSSQASKDLWAFCRPLFLASSIPFFLTSSLHLPTSFTHSPFLLQNHFFWCTRSSRHKNSSLLLLDVKKDFRPFGIGCGVLSHEVLQQAPMGLSLDPTWLGGQGLKLQRPIRTHQAVKWSSKTMKEKPVENSMLALPLNDLGSNELLGV